MVNWKLTKGMTALLAGCLMTITSAAAQTAAEFYDTHDVTLVVSAAPAGGADIYARAFAPFLGKYLPGEPNIIVTNVPGGSGLTAATQLQNKTEPDGATLSLLQSNNLYIPLISAEPVAFDPREVEWLGSLSRERHVLVTWKNTNLKTFDDVLKATSPVIIGATTINQINGTLPALMKQAFPDVPIELVTGYQGTDEILLAMQRGEVMARSQSVTSLFAGSESQYVKSGELIPLVQLTRSAHPNLPGVPVLMDYVKDEASNKVFDFFLLPLAASRPFAVPKGVPEDRLAALREAFEKAAKDPEFHAALAQMMAETELLTGPEVADIVTKIYATPPETLDRVKAFLN